MWKNDLGRTSARLRSSDSTHWESHTRKSPPKATHGIHAMVTREFRTYVRWTCLVVLFMWSFPPEGVDESSSAERRLDGVDVDFVAASNQNTVPSFSVTVDPGCSQNTSEDTYSVIVLSDDMHISNLFQAHERMCAYSRGLVSVQVANPIYAPRWEDSPHYPPFSLGHPPGVSRRVRIYYTSHKTHRAMGAVSGCWAFHGVGVHKVIVCTRENVACNASTTLT